MSAGWDHLIFLWDLRTGSPEKHIFGPLICGDSLDYNDNLILAGSWR